MELKGKKIAFLGDSITEGVGVDDIENCRYDNRLKKMLGLEATYNHGISGTRLAHQSVPSERPRHDLCFCGRAYDIEKDADVIIVYGGVNDYIHGDARFGTMKDDTPATFCGAVDFLMRLLKEEHPNAVIVFLTPAHMQFFDIYDNNPSTRPMKKSDARPLYDYCRVIIEKGKQYNVNVIDLYNTLGIDPNRSEDKVKYTADGLHFNNEGQGVLAQCVADFLCKI